MLEVHEKCLLLGDYNGQVGKDSDGYDNVHEGFGYGQENTGEKVALFCR